MMTYFRIPENVGHYVNRVRPPPCAQSVSANVPHSETPSRPQHNYVVYPPEADRSVIEPETIRERAKELRARVQK
jgi:hypothetical protein